MESQRRYRHVPGWGPLCPLHQLHPSCTRSVGILGLPPLCFLFFVFPSRPLPLTPRAAYFPGDQKHSALAKSHSTHGGPECPSPQRCSGESIARADYLQSVSGNSRVLDTLGLKSQVVAYDQSSHLLRAVEQLESRARHCLQVAQNVQLEVDPDSLSTTWSIPGVCCTSAHPPAMPSHPAARRSQIQP